MFDPFAKLRPRQSTARLAHELVDSLVGGPAIRRVLVVGRESEAVARVLRGRLPQARVEMGANRLLAEGPVDLVVSAWSGTRDAKALVSRLSELASGGAAVAVLDQGASGLVEVLKSAFVPLSFDLRGAPQGGPPLLRFVGELAA